MRRAWGVMVGGLLTIGVAGVPMARAVVPLPPPPALPPTTPPAAVEPFLAVAGPTVGALCGTASLGALLTPSLAEGFFHIPLDQLIDRHTLGSYANAALYVCGFIPAPLTASQCQVDRQILDALRGLNPLIAQVVGLYPEGATVDTILALEPLLPSGPAIAGPVVVGLSGLMNCTRSSGVPAVPRSHPASSSSPTTSAPTLPASSTPSPAASEPATPAGERPVAPSVPSPTPSRASSQPTVALPLIYETRLTARTARQWLGAVVGIVLLVASLGGWMWSRRSDLASK